MFACGAYRKPILELGFHAYTKAQFELTELKKTYFASSVYVYVYLFVFFTLSRIFIVHIGLSLAFSLHSNENVLDKTSFLTRTCVVDIDANVTGNERIAHLRPTSFDQMTFNFVAVQRTKTSDKNHSGGDCSFCDSFEKTCYD